MVGVAGKSKACNNCKRRRVKCDFQRPFCSRCAKAKITCTGYSKETVFVNRTLSSRNVTAATVLSDIRKCQVSTKRDFGEPHVQDNLHLCVSELFSPSYPLLELRPRAVQLLKKLYLPQKHAEGISSIQTCWGWLLAISDLMGPSQALDMCLQSLCVALLYVTGSVSLEKSLDLYNSAIQKLRADIDNPEVKLREETLAAIVVLSTSELFLNPVDSSWRAHARGISEILRLRGPVGTVDCIWHRLCSRLQNICVLDALTNRQSLLLTIQEWRNFKYTNATGEMGEFDELIDIISEAPALLEQTKAFLERPDIKVLPDCGYSSVIRRMDTWQQRMRDASKTPLYWSVKSALTPLDEIENSKNPFPFVWEFKSLDVAISFVFSWGVLVQIYCSLIRIYSFIEDASRDGDGSKETLEQGTNSLPEGSLNDDKSSMRGFTTSPSIDWPSKVFYEEAADKYARLICQSLEYCHRVDMGLVGPQATAFSQWIVREYFRRLPGRGQELAWYYKFKNTKVTGFRCDVEIMKFTAYT